jgi:flagellin-specific chaperone FliS
VTAFFTEAKYSRRALFGVVRYTKGMKLSEEQIDEFIAIYKEEFNEALDHSQAEEIARNFIALYAVLASTRPA